MNEPEDREFAQGMQNECANGSDDWIAPCCPFTLTIAGHTMRCQMDKGHHLQSEHSFSIDWAHDQSDPRP